MKRHLSVATILLTLLMLPTMAAAMDATGASGVRLVTGGDYPPYAGPDLPGYGMATVIVLTAFEAVGVKVEPIEFMPWKRGFEAVLDGEFDATFPYVAAPGRDEAMSFSTPIYDIPIYPVFRADRARVYTGPTSLAGLTLCQPVGYAQPVALQAMVDAGTLRLVQPASMTLCARQLLAGRVDFLVNSVALFDATVLPEWHDGPPPVMASQPVESNPLYMLVARTNPKAADLLARFAAGMAILRADGRYDAIVERFLPSGQTGR